MLRGYSFCIYFGLCKKKKIGPGSDQSHSNARVSTATTSLVPHRSLSDHRSLSSDDADHHHHHSLLHDKASTCFSGCGDITPWLFCHNLGGNDKDKDNFERETRILQPAWWWWLVSIENKGFNGYNLFESHRSDHHRSLRCVRMDPAVLIFLLYVMIAHELVCGLMQYRRQSARPPARSGPKLCTRWVTRKKKKLRLQLALPDWAGNLPQSGNHEGVFIKN